MDALSVVRSRVTDTIKDFPAWQAESVLRTGDGVIHAIIYNSRGFSAPSVYDNLHHMMSNDDGATWTLAGELDPPTGFRFKQDSYYKSGQYFLTDTPMYSVCLGPDDEVIVVVRCLTDPGIETDSPWTPRALYSYVYSGSWAAPELIVNNSDYPICTRDSLSCVCDGGGRIHVLYDQRTANPPIWNTSINTWYARSTAVSGGSWTVALAFDSGGTGAYVGNAIALGLNDTPTAFIVTTPTGTNLGFWSQYVDGAWTALEQLDWILEGYPEDAGYLFDGAEWHGIQYDWYNENWNGLIYATTTNGVWGSAVEIPMPLECDLSGGQLSERITQDSEGTLWTVINVYDNSTPLGTYRFLVFSKPLGGAWALQGFVTPDTDDIYWDSVSMMTGSKPDSGYALLGTDEDNYWLMFINGMTNTPPATPPVPVLPHKTRHIWLCNLGNRVILRNAQ